MLCQTSIYPVAERPVGIPVLSKKDRNKFLVMIWWTDQYYMNFCFVLCVLNFDLYIYVDFVDFSHKFIMHLWTLMCTKSFHEDFKTDLHAED